ncbi:hypothetical protein DM860_004995 [Cuscuta australis]|uniref:Uncharacterized protein n=1 Tax=Cuscuta australis TaxID=267555 RepID=A0A328DML5_9ASTE|nr:hypothetical protein DM860_004995 [Cuscuta australis]
MSDPRESGTPVHPQPSPAPPPPSSLYKQNTWSPDTFRDEVWQRRKGNQGIRRRERGRSVTDEDLDEFKACMELGFGFDSPTMDKRLSDTFPAYGLFYAVNKHYNDTVSKTAPSSSSSVSDCDSPSGSPSSSGSPPTIFAAGENQQTMKTRLKQWAQVVAYSVRQSSSN